MEMGLDSLANFIALDWFLNHFNKCLLIQLDHVDPIWKDFLKGHDLSLVLFILDEHPSTVVLQIFKDVL